MKDFQSVKQRDGAWNFRAYDREMEMPQDPEMDLWARHMRGTLFRHAAETLRITRGGNLFAGKMSAAM